MTHKIFLPGADTCLNALPDHEPARLIFPLGIGVAFMWTTDILSGKPPLS